ncbi:acyl-CoA reductase-like NAD-dependent aldehyde dehydrogenase [Arthrobacter sp. W4I7]|nr:acyl-CoA reductase-like NAD-dependent aldehyde dehydrogenase [Arthrobacter sp. W4I7]
MAYASVNPYTNETLKTYPTATDVEIDEVLAARALPWRVRPGMCCARLEGRCRPPLGAA